MSGIPVARHFSLSHFLCLQLSVCHNYLPTVLFSSSFTIFAGAACPPLSYELLVFLSLCAEFVVLEPSSRYRWIVCKKLLTLGCLPPFPFKTEHNGTFLSFFCVCVCVVSSLPGKSLLHFSPITAGARRAVAAQKQFTLYCGNGLLRCHYCPQLLQEQ